MTIHNSLAELIGNTPLVKLNHIPQAAGVKATIAVKVEYFNPCLLYTSISCEMTFPHLTLRR